MSEPILVTPKTQEKIKALCYSLFNEYQSWYEEAIAHQMELIVFDALAEERMKCADLIKSYMDKMCAEGTVEERLESFL